MPTPAETAAAWIRSTGVDLEPWQLELLEQLLPPLPDPLERVQALAEYSQLVTPAHPDEHRFAHAAYTAAGGRDLTPWRAFQAGLRAAAEWGGRRA